MQTTLMEYNANTEKATFYASNGELLITLLLDIKSAREVEKAFRKAEAIVKREVIRKAANSLSSLAETLLNGD